MDRHIMKLNISFTFSFYFFMEKGIKGQEGSGERQDAKFHFRELITETERESADLIPSSLNVISRCKTCTLECKILTYSKFMNNQFN
jgi:hypothetical protein